MRTPPFDNILFKRAAESGFNPLHFKDSAATLSEISCETREKGCGGALRRLIHL